VSLPEQQKGYSLWVVLPLEHEIVSNSLATVTTSHDHKSLLTDYLPFLDWYKGS